MTIIYGRKLSCQASFGLLLKIFCSIRVFKNVFRLPGHDVFRWTIFLRTISEPVFKEGISGSHEKGLYEGCALEGEERMSGQRSLKEACCAAMPFPFKRRHRLNRRVESLRLERLGAVREFLDLSEVPQQVFRMLFPGLNRQLHQQPQSLTGLMKVLG